MKPNLLCWCVLSGGVNLVRCIQEIGKQVDHLKRLLHRCYCWNLLESFLKYFQQNILSSSARAELTELPDVPHTHTHKYHQIRGKLVLQFLELRSKTVLDLNPLRLACLILITFQTIFMSITHTSILWQLTNIELTSRSHTSPC